MDEVQKDTEMGKSEHLIHDVIDILKSNQEIVNSLVESNVELRNTVEDLANNVDDIVQKMDEFIELLHTASEVTLEEDMTQNIGKEVLNPVVSTMTEKMQEMTDNITDTNKHILTALEDLDKRVKKMYGRDKLRKPRLHVQRRRSTSLLENEEEEE